MKNLAKFLIGSGLVTTWAWSSALSCLLWHFDPFAWLITTAVQTWPMLLSWIHGLLP